MKNRKQTHRIVVATLLLISCFSSGVFAGEAKFNDIEYNTLAEAITAANTDGNGGTIQMLQDVTLTSALPAISVSGVLTFSLGGYELQADEAIGNVIEITEGYMNLNNGKIIGMVPLSCGAGTTVHMDIWLISKGTTCLLLDGATVSIEGFNFYGNILSISQSSVSVEGNSFFSQDPSDYVDMSTYTVNKAHYSCTAGGNTYILEYQVQKKEGNILYNNDHFSTLEDAVQAANLQGGGTITLLDNVSVSKTININTTEPITIEMSHFSITDARTDSLDDYLIKAYAHLILQNGSFTQAESAAGASGLIFSNTNFFLTLDNITIQGTSYKGGYKLGAILVQGSADFKDINISDNTITNETYNMGGYVCAMGNITLHGKIVIANNKYTIENNNIAANFFGGRANLWLGDFETGDVGQATISAEDLDYGSNIHVSSMDTYQQPASYNEILVGNISSIFFPYFHSDDYYNSVNNSYSSLLVFDNGSYLADEYYRTISSSHETYGNATVWMSNNAPFSIRLLNPDNEWTLNDYTWTAVENNFHYSLNNLTNYGTSVQLPTPTREGYIFRGWVMNINDTITYTSASTPTDFYAIWKIDPNSNYWVAKGYFDGEELFFPTLEDAFRTLGEMGGEITLLQDCSAGAEDDLRSYSELTIQGQNHTITDARGTGNGTDSEGTSSGNNLRESEGLFVADWPITFLNTRFSQSAESKSFHTFIYSQDVLRFDGCTISGLTYGDSTQSYIITNGLEITNSTIANNLTSHGTVNRIHCMGQSQISLTGSVSADLLRGANDFWSVYDNGLTEGSHVTVSLQTHESGGDDIRIGTGNLSTIQYIHSATPGLEFIYDNGSMCVDMYNHSVEAKHSMERGSIWLSTNVTYKVILEPKVEDFTLDTTIYQEWTATEAGYECTFNKETLTLPQIKAEGYIFLGWKTEQDTTRYVTSVSQPCTLYGNWQVDPTSDVWVVKRADGTLVKDFVSAVTEDNKTGRSDTLTLLQDITLKESVTFIAPVMLNGNNKALSTLNENATITFSSTTPSTLQDIRFNTNTAVTISTPLNVTGLVSMRFTFIDGAYLIKIGELSAATNLYYMGTAPVSSDDILLMKGGIFADLSLFKSTSENIHPYIFDDGNMSINIIDREVTGHHTHDANSIWYASDDGGFDYTVITLENPDNLWKLTNDDIMDWTFVDGNYIHSISGTPVTLPKPIRDGYTFTGWFEFHASTGQYTQVSSATTATVLEAQWTESTSTPYVVNNYQQNINNDQYTLFETDSLLGTTNDSVTPTPKFYKGFVTPHPQTAAIAADGSTVINYQYEREQYTITFQDGNGNTLQVSNWKFGAMPSYGDTIIPKKDATAEYSYTWNNGWQPTLVTVSDTATYTATFDAKPVSYQLQWITDGDSLQGTYTSGNVEFGTAITTPDTPTKQGYTFKEWVPQPLATMPAENIAYTATWKESTSTPYVVNYYQQNIDDDQYTLFETDSLLGTTNDTVTPTPKSYAGFITPQPQTATIFADGSTIIDYQYAREQYTIIFKDGDDNVIQESAWKYGAIPVYTGNTPQKTATARVTYTWNNAWKPAITVVSDTATYTASFEADTIPPRDLSELQQAFGPAASVVEQQDGSILITLNDSINTSVSISDIWGDITLDLNGYSITGNQGSQSDLDGKPALALTSSTPAGAGTNLTIKDNSGNSGTVQGGRGYDGQDGATGEDGEDGGNGGSAIVNESSSSIYSIEDPVIILGGDGGNGGNSTFGVGGNGGNGGAPGGNGGNGGEGGLRPGVGGQGAEGGQSGHEGQPIPIILGSNNPDDKGTYVDEQGYCPADGEGAVGYHLKQGMPTHYQLLFDSAAHVAGFIDIEWTAANIDSLQGHLSILFPALCPFGTYRADLYLKNENTGYISEAQTITFQVNVPKEKVLQMYSDVITLDLSDTTIVYSGFQWYHDSGNGFEIIPGATLPYYKEEGGLTGSYYVAIEINGKWTRTCHKTSQQMPSKRRAQKLLLNQQLILITEEGHQYNIQGQKL